MSWITKEKWNQLDDLLNDAGCCGYHDFCEVLRGAIREMGSTLFQDKKELERFVTNSENKNDLGTLKDKLLICTDLLQKKKRNSEPV